MRRLTLKQHIVYTNQSGFIIELDIVPGFNHAVTVLKPDGESYTVPFDWFHAERARKYAATLACMAGATRVA